MNEKLVSNHIVLFQKVSVTFVTKLLKYCKIRAFKSYALYILTYW